MIAINRNELSPQPTLGFNYPLTSSANYFQSKKPYDYRLISTNNILVVKVNVVYIAFDNTNATQTNVFSLKCISFLTPVATREANIDFDRLFTNMILSLTIYKKLF